MIKESYIYNGEVIHKRFKPKFHYFKYKVFSLFIDLNELNKISQKVRSKKFTSSCIRVINEK